MAADRDALLAGTGDAIQRVGALDFGREALRA
jgi:hypothetical protein